MVRRSNTVMEQRSPGRVEARRVRRRWLVTVLGVAVALLALVHGPAHATTLLISTTGNEIIDGTGFADGDLVSIDQTPSTASLFLSEAIFADDENIDATALLPNGCILLSTQGSATIPGPSGVSFDDGDLVKYDPSSGEASIFLSESVFGSNVDVDTAHVLGNGNILVSFRADTTIGTDLFLDGDIIEYDGAGGFSVFLSESIFGENVDVNGFSILDDDTYLLSVRDDSGADIGPLEFADGDVVRYDPSSQTASIFLSVELRSSTDPDVSAIAVLATPEPSTFLLVAPGLVTLALASRRNRRLAQPTSAR